MNIYKLGLAIAVASSLSACGGDSNNNSEVDELQTQVEELQQQITDLNANSDTIAALEQEIISLETALATMDADNATEIEAMETLLDDLQEQLAALTVTNPVLGVNATSGSNKLAEDSDVVWRFAVFPDSQGRDDDNMTAYVNVDKDGNTLAVSEWIGVDFNGDGYYDAGTESQVDSVKEGDWDEDGISYLVNVMDPFHPYIETDEAGDPIVVAPEDRKDFGPDWKILPVPLTDAVTDKIIELDVDLVLAIGDYTEYRAESDYVQWMDKVANVFTEADIPVFPVRGNHEIVNGRNWPAWFTNTQEWERQSVNNVYNDINPYDGSEISDFDQGYKLYQAYAGGLVQGHIDDGLVTGFPGAEDLNYYFVHENTLFIAIDNYFAQLDSSVYNGTWITLRGWLEEVIKTNAENVDHIVVFGHEPISTKQRPQTYDVETYDIYNAERASIEETLENSQSAVDQAISDGASAEELAILNANLEAAQSAYEELEEPGVIGYDIGQLGYMMLQDDSAPGLAEDILSLFSEYKVTYISGHDHQYSRSLIHATPDDKDSSKGFMQIIAGNASWKAYENLYGIEENYETGLYLKNFYDTLTGGDLINSEGTEYASVTSSLGNGIAFILVEFNGRQISTKAYFAEHGLTEVDMNLGAHYDFDTNSWCEFSGDFMVEGSVTTETCSEVNWQIIDDSTRTTDAAMRVVEPMENYFLTSATPENSGYIGSEASIVDGYNLTYDAIYAGHVERLEMMRELVSMSWFTDKDDTTVSDILWISGNQTQEGGYFSEYGEVDLPLIEVDAGELALGAAPSLTYTNRNLVQVNNPTHVTRDGVFNKGVDIEASLNSDIVNGNPSGNDALWDSRYLNDDLDFADAMVLAFKIPDGENTSDLILGRYDEASASWVSAFVEDCFIESGYSEHFTPQYRISEQHPEGGTHIDNCQQRYWGYTNNTIWGFIHTDGKFALIRK